MWNSASRVPLTGITWRAGSTIPSGRRKRRPSQLVAALRNGSVPVASGYLPHSGACSWISFATIAGGANCGSPTDNASGVFPPPACTLSSSLLRRVKGWNRISDSSRSVVMGSRYPIESGKGQSSQCATRTRLGSAKPAQSGNIETTLRTQPQAIVLTDFESHNRVLIGNLESFRFGSAPSRGVGVT